MFLSAVLFAAALQTAPEVDLKNYLDATRLSESRRSVDELTVPLARKPKWVKSDPAVLPWRASSSSRWVKAPPLGFVRNPQMVNCRTAPRLAGHPETLKGQPLSKMPQAHGEWAVARLVDGCPVAVPIVQRTPSF